MEAPRIHRKPVSKPSSGHEPASSAPRRMPSNYSLRVGLDETQKQFGMMSVNDGQSGDHGPLRTGTAAAAPASATTLAPPAYTRHAAAATPAYAVEDNGAPPLRSRPSVIGQFGPGIAPGPDPATPVTPTTTGLSTASTAVEDNGDSKPKDSFWKTALDETRFFAGGLIQKPYESTKHYTVLRHSGGLVMYRGPSTSVVVTLFSSPDRRVSSSPRERTVWLQRRGYSGDTGLRLKTLVGASSSWLDVTPERPAAASELPAADERGYQRDIQKFLKKTVPGGKHFDKSVARRVPGETLVVRIPAACTDGYFRLIVCGSGAPQKDGTQKKKVLCGSPVFRVASMSTDASILRGASLSTLPMEAGVKIASLLGARYVAGAAAPIVSTVQAQVSKYQPSAASIMAAQTAYESLTLPASVGAAGASYDEARAAAYEALAAESALAQEEDVPPEVLGDDSGPSHPFPVQFQGHVVPGTGRSAAELGVPTANLAGVPDDIRLRLRGVYCGWAAVTPSSKKSAESAALPRDWIEAVVTVAPPQQSSKAAVVHQNEVSAHLLCDLGPASLVGEKVSIILMAFLSSNIEAASPGSSSLVVASLSRPAWRAQATLARIEAERSERSVSRRATDKYVDTRGRVQKQVDRIPFHWAGVRTAGGEMRDQFYGNGGFWIPR